MIIKMKSRNDGYDSPYAEEARKIRITEVTEKTVQFEEVREQNGTEYDALTQKQRYDFDTFEKYFEVIE